MSLSVSSEWAFSQGGITISKCRSCLKGDIVEALQCIKCAIWHDLLFRKPAPSSKIETEETTDQGLEDKGGIKESGEGKDFLWDEILIEDKDLESMDYSD